jgi:hypothetical protein
MASIPYTSNIAYLNGHDVSRAIGCCQCFKKETCEVVICKKWCEYVLAYTLVQAELNMIFDQFSAAPPSHF